MSINPYPVQQDILAYMDETFAQTVYRGGVTDAESLQYDKRTGELKPYIAVKFSDVSRDPRGNSFAGARHDTYVQYADLYMVAGDQDKAMALHGYVMDKMIGYIPAQAGEINKTSGSGSFVILDGREKPAAFVSILGLRWVLNFTNQG